MTESPPLAKRVFEEHGPAVHRYFRRLTGDSAAAEDLTQEVFLRVVRAADEYEPRERERAWVFRIARNVLVDRRRQQGRVPISSAHIEPATQAAQTTRVSIREALAQLPPEEREAFLLREIAGLGYAEIAAATDSTVAGVRSRIYRARVALRDMLVPPAPIALTTPMRRDEDHD